MKEEKKPINIVFVALDSKLANNVSSMVSEKLGMFFSDSKDYIEYDLYDSKAVLNNCGVDYLKDRETKALKNLLSFHNLVVNCNFDLFKHNRKVFTNKSLICYLKIPQNALQKSEVVNKLSYLSHDEYLSKNCDVQIELKSSNINVAVKRTLEVLGESL